MSEEESIQLPAEIEQKLREISSKTGIDYDFIRQDYLRAFLDPFVQEDESFSSDEERHAFCIKIIMKNYLLRPPVKPETVIVVGLGSERITSGGMRQREIMVLWQQPNSKKWILRRLVLQEPVVDEAKNLVLFAAYQNVMLGEFSPGGDFVADNRADFSKPIKTKLNYDTLLKVVGAQRVPSLKEAAKYASRKGADGYTDVTDWKIVRGIIDRYYVGQRKDGTPFAVMNIVDESIMNKTYVTEDGKILRPGFTVWVAPEFVRYSRDSECDFVGTIAVDEKGEASMNAYLVIPVHAKPIEEV